MQLEASPDGQLGKWGFVPGAEDTMDLNLEDKGQQLPANVHVLPRTHQSGLGYFLLSYGQELYLDKQPENIYDISNITLTSASVLNRHCPAKTSFWPT